MTFAVFNPKNIPVNYLPYIYGFNNGGSRDWWDAALIAEDGTYLGGHICSHEGYMPGDLGCLEGSRPDRHEGFKLHYPDGYRMTFVGQDDFDTSEGLKAAIALNKEKAANAEPT